jgi:hypothetical protein
MREDVGEGSAAVSECSEEAGPALAAAAAPDANIAEAQPQAPLTPILERKNDETEDKHVKYERGRDARRSVSRTSSGRRVRFSEEVALVDGTEDV